MKPVSVSAKRLLVIGAVAGAVACHVAAAAVFATRDPYETPVFAPCPVLQHTGWQCPGCGSTRALFSLLHGDVVLAFAMNPLLLSAYASAALLIAMKLAEGRRRARLARGLSRAAVGLVVTAAIYSGVVRNLLAG